MNKHEKEWEKGFGARLKAIRKKLGYTQASLAEKAGIAVSVISDFECSRRLPSLTNIYRLVLALHVSADCLFPKEKQA